MLVVIALLACDPSENTLDPERTDDRAAEAPPPADAGPLAVQYVETDGLADGAAVVSAVPFRSFALVVTADPGAAFEYRWAEGDGWSDWHEAAWDWSLDGFANGHQVLPEAVEAVEVRADGAASFVQVELFEGEERIHDDDWPDGAPSAERAISGMWTLSYDAWAVGQGWYLPYEYATHCTGALLPGSEELGRHLVDHYGASSFQGYACRIVRGGSSLSVHSSGRAIDVFVPTDGGAADNGEGDPIAEFLVRNAEEIGISLIIWDRASWGAHRSGDKHQSYGGVHPHHDHLHIELTSAGANRSTPWFTSGGDLPEVEGWIGLAARPTGDGYWVAHTDGRVEPFGAAPDHGDAGGWTLAAPVRGVVSTVTGDGYWLFAEDGGVFAFGDAPFHGSMGGTVMNAPVVGMAATPSGNGYWLVGSDGGVFAFGDAGFYGSTGDIALNAPVVGLEPTATGRGYWLVAEDGGVFAFGDAGFHGSMGGTPLNAPVRGVASDGDGYWLVAEDGGVFAFAAGFHGSMGGTSLAAPVYGIEATPSGAGYWMVGLDGGVFTFGDAGFHGSAVGR